MDDDTLVEYRCKTASRAQHEDEIEASGGEEDRNGADVDIDEDEDRDCINEDEDEELLEDGSATL